MTRQPELIPTPLLFGCGALMLAAVAGVGVARLSGLGLQRPAAITPLVSAELRFVDEAEGGVGVYDGRTGERLRVYKSGEGGFVRQALRAVTFARREAGLGAAAPLTLARTAEGRLILTDPTTGRRIGLEAFGKTNADDFRELLELAAAQ